VGDEADGLRGLAISLPVAAVLSTVVAAPSAVPRLDFTHVIIGPVLALLVPFVPFLAASAIVAIAGVIGVLVVAYTSLYVWLNRTLLRDAAEQVLADWDCRLSLTTMPYEREVLCSEAPVEVLEAMFLMPSARQRRRFPARTSR
jgi:hypothetical protein